jgi:hydrogenase/urease accessory protein HupE
MIAAPRLSVDSPHPSRPPPSRRRGPEGGRGGRGAFLGRCPRAFLLALAVALALFVPRPADAHDPFEITTDAHIAGVELRLHSTLSLLTAGRICLPERTGKPLVRAGYDGVRGALESCARDFFVVMQAGQALAPRAVRVLLTVEDDLDITTSYPRPTRSPLAFDAVYLRRAVKHPSAGVVLTVTGERAFLGQQLLRPEEPTLSVSLEPDAARADAPRAPPPSFTQFLALGVRHILTGYDHLLFLLGLLIACRTLRAVLGVVTCFTVAHSLTLALAGLGVVTLPSRLVESLIAATIVVVGIENLRGAPGPSRWRYLLTFAFGLLHGFGFASALRDVGLGQNGAPIVLPLFGFNLGVEIGQIAVAAIALPILWRLRAVPRFARYGAPALSIGISAAGLIWLVQRLS